MCGGDGGDETGRGETPGPANSQFSRAGKFERILQAPALMHDAPILGLREALEGDVYDPLKSALKFKCQARGLKQCVQPSSRQIAPNSTSVAVCPKVYKTQKSGTLCVCVCVCVCG